ncbi:glutathione S-transferase family protein [Litoreibacter janthinus]|uniref:Glutathione S-transferase n=1 Tax=Litoreibacter janthinus TaxID=670154 RepID=A0A1I6GTX3_9RHOB|nr:glutathione S-transferase [Litoreibacter janthinus]SFR45694.1 glutathione S-transferase [Litoreibacter janthinus]
MITLHALKYSRATRVLWLLHDLGQSCERVDYDRTENFRAPPALGKVHPLGKSPVIEDNGQLISESATILRYLAEKYRDTQHRPPSGSPEFWRHETLLDYAEASFAEVAMQSILPAFDGKDIPEASKAALDKHLDYISSELGEGPLLFGSALTLADIQISYILALLDRFELLGSHPSIADYWQRLQEQSGYIAALTQVGPMAPPKD